MNKTPLLLVPLALLCTAGLWFLSANGDEPPPVTVEDHSPTNGADAQLVQSTTSRPTDASTEAPLDAVARDAVSTREALVPIPEDASWIEVRIVDKATGTSVPGATVFWYDEAIEKELRANPAHIDRDRYSVWLDTEELASQFGWETASDDRGIARIHQTDSTKVAARHGNLYGRADLGTEIVPPRGGYQVELEPDLEFRVRVIDASGQPAIGVPVAIAMYDSKGEFHRLVHWNACASSRAPDGIAPLRHAQLWQWSRQAQGGPFSWRVRAYLPGLDDTEVAFDLEELPRDPLILQLPPCGQIRARAELQGRVATIAECYLRADVLPQNDRQQQAMITTRPDSDGWARFEHVPLGLKYSAHATLNGSWVSASFAGPVSDGAEVEVVMSPKDGEILLTGRVLDSNRAPLADEALELQIRGKRLRNSSDLQTDSEGRFLAIIGRARDDNTADSILVRVQRDGERPLVARAVARELRSGTEDLGDLVLQLDTLLVAGRCTADGVPCKLPRHARVQQFVEREGRQPGWDGVDDLGFFTADDGTFEYRGTPAPGRFRLSLSAREHLPIEPIEFTLGTKDVAVALQSGSKLAATMLTPEGSQQALTAELAASSATGRDTAPSSQQQQRLRARVWTRPDDRQQADWKGLPPGTYELSLALIGVVEPIAKISGITVPPPADGDPRLVDIDLRDLLQQQVIRLHDDGGNAIAQAYGGFFPLGQDPDGDLRGFACHSTETTLTLPRGSTPLLVGIPGYRPTEILCTGTPLDVRLDRWSTVTLLFTDLPEVPAECTLQARLLVPKPATRQWRTQFWFSGSVDELLAPPARPLPIENGKVELPIGDEAQAIEVSVRHNRRSVTVEIPEQQARMTNRTITVRVTPEAWQKAITEVTSPK